jgi:N,N'-diacetyllegionaminate synthase
MDAKSERSYPTKAEEIGLNVISELKNRYKCKVGLSDHSGTIYPSIASIPLGHPE